MTINGTIRLLFCAFLLLAVGGVGGWYAAARPAGPPNPPKVEAVPKVRFRAADEKILSKLPKLKEWEYPESQLVEGWDYFDVNCEVGGLGFAGTSHVTRVTTDDFDTVWAYYRERFSVHEHDLQGDDPPKFLPSSQTSFDTRERVVTVFDDTSARSFSGPPSDLLQSRGFIVHSPRYQLIGFIYRPQGADETVIILVYRPMTEFLGLLQAQVKGTEEFSIPFSPVGSAGGWSFTRMIRLPRE